MGLMEWDLGAAGAGFRRDLAPTAPRHPNAPGLATCSIGNGRLCGWRHRSGLGECGGEPGKDRQVGVQPDPLDPPDPQG